MASLVKTLEDILGDIPATKRDTSAIDAAVATLLKALEDVQVKRDYSVNDAWSYLLERLSGVVSIWDEKRAGELLKFFSFLIWREKRFLKNKFLGLAIYHAAQLKSTFHAFVVLAFILDLHNGCGQFEESSWKTSLSPAGSFVVHTQIVVCIIWWFLFHSVPWPSWKSLLKQNEQLSGYEGTKRGTCNSLSVGFMI